MNKFKFYTDGTRTIRVEIGQPAPAGFHPGCTFNAKPWNKGLTAATDSRVALYAKNRTPRGNFIPWNEGLTKEESPSLQRVAQKVSASRKGKTSWNKGIPMSAEARAKLSRSHLGKPSYWKGRTKDTDPKLQARSEKVRGKSKRPTNWTLAKQREYQTRRAHGTLNSSSLEERVYQDLIACYGEDNVFRQHFDIERYPFKCDFYIKSVDKFIELHGSWVHGPGPFNPDDPAHIKLLEEWQKKASNSKYYRSAIYTWTDLDVRKLQTARQNNLNFEFIYNHYNLVIST